MSNEENGLCQRSHAPEGHGEHRRKKRTVFSSIEGTTKASTIFGGMPQIDVESPNLLEFPFEGRVSELEQQLRDESLRALKLEEALRAADENLSVAGAEVEKLKTVNRRQERRLRIAAARLDLDETLAVCLKEAWELLLMLRVGPQTFESLIAAATNQDNAVECLCRLKLQDLVRYEAGNFRLTSRGQSKLLEFQNLIGE